MASSTIHPPGGPMPSSRSKFPSAPVSSSEDPIVQFTTAGNLAAQIDHVPGDILIVRDVSPQDFTAIEEEREKRRRKYRFRRYYADSRILIITIPTGIHEQLHLTLYSMFKAKCLQMGLGITYWIDIGTTTYRTTRGHPGGDGGEGDSTGGPTPDRVGAEDWPTLVIEAGDSETLNQLRVDIRWWFSASNHHVKIVILAKFDRRQRKITLEKWEEEANAQRPGATMTRSASILQPVLRQTITITRNPTDPITYNVVSSPLVLGFTLLFLRDPDPGEGDIVLNDADLQFYAGRVWGQVQD